MNPSQKRIHQTIYILAMLVVGGLGLADLWLLLSLMEGVSSFLRVAFLLLAGGFILGCLGFVHHLHQRHQRLLERNALLVTEKQSLEALNRAKSEFLSMMSHEFRTPLNAIIGFAEVLQAQAQGELNPTQQRYVGNILKGGSYLLALINNVLDLSRIELGKLTLRWGPSHLDEMLNEVVHCFQVQAREKGVILECEVDAEMPPIHADATRLRQVFYNLVHNAIKFTPAEGKVRIHGYMAPQQAVVVVQDTGIGIAAENHHKVFEMFAQVDSSYSRNQQGTGLGLALTRQLVELHGGTIDLVSSLGQGATFTVRLPRFARDQSLEESAQAPQQAAA